MTSPEEKSKGVKLSNNKSIFNKKPEASESFDDRADEIFADHENKKQRCLKLGVKFLSILNDKTLLENRSPIIKDLEKQIVNELISLANDINNDEMEDEGMGSMAIMTLLIRTTLMQRDKINELDYKLHKFESEINKISTVVK